MEALQTLMTTLPLALTAGINLYATVLVAGLAMRFGWVSDAPPALAVLGSWPVIITAAVMYVIEFVVDKFQFFDNAWDIIHTFIRPLGAIAIAIILAYGEGDPAVTVVAVLLAGSVSLIAHTGKAGTRFFVNVVSPYENVTNIGLSVTEDVTAGGLALLALGHPYLAAGIAAALLATIVLFLPRLLRWGWFSLKAAAERIAAAFGHRAGPDLVPPSHLALVGHEAPALAAQARALKIRWIAGRAGYLAIVGNRLAFTYAKWFLLKRAWVLALDQVQAAYFRRSWLADTIEVHYRDEKGQPRVARFVFTRYRSPLAEEFARRLRARGLEAALAGAADRHVIATQA